MDCDAGFMSLEFFTVKLVIISNWSCKSVFSSLHEFLVQWYHQVFWLHKTNSRTFYCLLKGKEFFLIKTLVGIHFH